MERFSKLTVRKALARRFESAYKEVSSPDRDWAARARGVQAAIEYLSVGFDLEVCRPLDCKRFVYGNGKPMRLTKETLAAMILARVSALPGFDSGNGYAQVTGNGEMLNEKYGEWRYLLDIAAEYR